MARQRFEDVVIDPTDIIAVSKKGIDNCSMVINVPTARRGENACAVIPISWEGAIALLKHFEKQDTATK